MKTQLKQSFFQVFTATLLWLVFLLNFFSSKQRMVSVGFIWNVVVVALTCALVFGVLYRTLWYHLTLKPVWNVLIASVANASAGFLLLWLIFPTMFFTILPWTPIIVALNLLLHTIAFYVYGRYESKKQAEKLNDLLMK